MIMSDNTNARLPRSESDPRLKNGIRVCRQIWPVRELRDQARCHPVARQNLPNPDGIDPNQVEFGWQRD